MAKRKCSWDTIKWDGVRTPVSGGSVVTPPPRGRRQRGGQWCLATPFEIGAPHFTFPPPDVTYIQYCIFKMCPTLLVFGPSFWFLPPPAAKSWRRACWQSYLQQPSGDSGTRVSSITIYIGEYELACFVYLCHHTRAGHTSLSC